MGVLDSVLAYKAKKDAEARADIDAIPLGIAAFTAAKQQAQKSMLDQLTYNAQLQKLNLDAQKQPYEISKLQSETNKANAESGVLSKFLGGDGNNNSDIQATEATIGGVKFENKKLAEQSAQEKSDREIDTQVKKDALQRFSKLDELIPLLDQYDQQLSSIPVHKGVRGKAEGVGALVSGKIGSDPFVASNLKQIDATRALAARAFGDVGNLSKSEQENAKGFFSQVTDPADTRVINTLGGLTLLRRKVVQTAQKAGLDKSPEFVSRLKQIDDRIVAKKAQALDLGVDSKRLNKFIGEKANTENVFSSEDEARKAGLKDGTPVTINGVEGKWYN